MELRLQLSLPRDAGGIPVARRLLRDSLRTIGVHPECIDDIELALSEACSNALRHAGPANTFHVNSLVDDRRCVIEVTDGGVGFDDQKTPEENLGAEHGRGIQLMRAVLDDLDYSVAVGGGTIARLTKNLTWAAPPFPEVAGARHWPGVDEGE